MDLLRVLVEIFAETARDSIADRLRGGTASEEMLRQLIQREIKDIKDSLTDLARKDLLSSVTFTDEGMVAMENYESTNDETSLSHAMDCFQQSIIWSTHAFENAGLSTQDRVLATKIKIAATLLKLQKTPELAVKLSVESLHKLCELNAVKKVFKDKFGWKKMFANKLDADNRQEVCAIKRAVVQYVLSNTSTTNMDWPLPSWHPPYNCIDFVKCEEFQCHFVSFAADKTVFALYSYLSLVRLVDIFTGDVVREFHLAGFVPESPLRSPRPLGLAYDPATKLIYVPVLIRDKMELILQVYDEGGKFTESFEVQKVNSHEEIESVALCVAGGRVVVGHGKNVWVLTTGSQSTINSKAFADPCSIAGCAIIGEEIHLLNSLNRKVLILSMNLDDSHELTLQDTEKYCNTPRGITHDALTGHIFIADRDTERVHVFTTQGHHVQKIKVIPGWLPDQVVISPLGYVLIRCYNPEELQHKLLVVE